ncbi:hypothetical protein CF161_01185 [Pseudomonas sp. CF161]|nr:hypothetical protein CF161_01185 [Pseudomonas sp. CF161]
MRWRMIEMPVDGGVFSGVPTSVPGELLSREAAIGFVVERFPSKPICLVQEWTILRADVSEDYLAKVTNRFFCLPTKSFTTVGGEISAR